MGGFAMKSEAICGVVYKVDEKSETIEAKKPTPDIANSHIYAPFLTLKEVAQKLRRSRASANRLIKRELLPSDPNNRHICVPNWAVDHYIINGGHVTPLWWNALPKKKRSAHGREDAP